MKPLPELRPGARLLAGARVMIDVLADQLAQHGPEVRHRLTSARFPTLDTTDRNAFLGHGTRLLHKLRESAASLAHRRHGVLRFQIRLSGDCEPRFGQL